jgi:hypothetical protein
MAAPRELRCIANRDFLSVENRRSDFLYIVREGRDHLHEAAEEQWPLRETFLLAASASLAFWVMLVEVLHFVAGL